MAGSRGTRPAPDPPRGPRAALVIATSSYQDEELRQLRAPARDAEDLAEVLADPQVGGFAVTQVIDADERQARRAIDVFLSGREADDVVVVYLSCHGVLDRRNRLYFAAADTMKGQLSSTGIPSAWLLDQLEDCRARRQVLILDCCFSGAFANGSKGDADLDLERRLAGHGRGQAVLTASRAGEYSFEGQALPDTPVSGSVFTAGLVEGLRTGHADAGGDGYVSVDEAYDYAYRYVQASGASQTPQRWLSGGEGAIVLARSPAGIVITPAPLPDDLTASLESRYPTVRIGAVHELGSWLACGDPARALTADQLLRQIADTDNPAVAAAARAYVASSGQPATQAVSGAPAAPAAPEDAAASAAVAGKDPEPVRPAEAPADNGARKVPKRSGAALLITTFPDADDVARVVGKLEGLMPRALVSVLVLGADYAKYADSPYTGVGIGTLSHQEDLIKRGLVTRIKKGWNGEPSNVLTPEGILAARILHADRVPSDALPAAKALRKVAKDSIPDTLRDATSLP